jgi:hypothetical protein
MHPVGFAGRDSRVPVADVGRGDRRQVPLGELGEQELVEDGPVLRVGAWLQLPLRQPLLSELPEPQRLRFRRRPRAADHVSTDSREVGLGVAMRFERRRRPMHSPVRSDVAGLMPAGRQDAEGAELPAWRFRVQASALRAGHSVSCRASPRHNFWHVMSSCVHYCVCYCRPVKAETSCRYRGNRAITGPSASRRR